MRDFPTPVIVLMAAVVFLAVPAVVAAEGSGAPIEVENTIIFTAICGCEEGVWAIGTGISPLFAPSAFIARGGTGSAWNPIYTEHVNFLGDIWCGGGEAIAGGIGFVMNLSGGGAWEVEAIEGAGGITGIWGGERRIYAVGGDGQGHGIIAIRDEEGEWNVLDLGRLVNPVDIWGNSTAVHAVGKSFEDGSASGDGLILTLQAGGDWKKTVIEDATIIQIWGNEDRFYAVGGDGEERGLFLIENDGGWVFRRTPGFVIDGVGGRDGEIYGVGENERDKPVIARLDAGGGWTMETVENVGSLIRVGGNDDGLFAVGQGLEGAAVVPIR